MTMDDKIKLLEDSMFEINLNSNRALEIIRIVCDVMQEDRASENNYDYPDILRAAQDLLLKNRQECENQEKILMSLKQ